MSNRGSALMGIGSGNGENRAAEAAKKAISSPLLETSIDGAQGVIMNITGGANLSLYEVQEAADIVASASDPEVNMIFGSVINEGLKDDIVVTVIATGFDDSASTQPPKPIIRPTANHTQQQQQPVAQPSKQREVKREMKREEPVVHDRHTDSDDIDIPAFLRNRRRR